ncbi:MAG: hypothetical protein FD167_5984 [bacterium]|nr:MAG: hypothetical protein FD167_5984 [bacterium]
MPAMDYVGSNLLLKTLAYLIKDFTILRHSCASLLLAQGVPARTVMEILGHSQISLTYEYLLTRNARNEARCSRFNGLYFDSKEVDKKIFFRIAVKVVVKSPKKAKG